MTTLGEVLDSSDEKSALLDTDKKLHFVKKVENGPGRMLDDETFAPGTYTVVGTLGSLPGEEDAHKSFDDDARMKRLIDFFLELFVSFAADAPEEFQLPFQLDLKNADGRTILTDTYTVEGPKSPTEGDILTHPDAQISDDETPREVFLTPLTITLTDATGRRITVTLTPSDKSVSIEEPGERS